jgi:hypothetical protein
MFRSSILSILFGALQVTAQTCQLQFDGRVPSNFTSDQFDVDNGLFNPGFVKGKGTCLCREREGNLTNNGLSQDLNSANC